MTRAELLEEVHSAFGGVSCPPREAMLLEQYRNGIDACEMADAFAGRHWSEIPRRNLFLHREMVIAMSAAAYRACLPAYLVASIESEPGDEYGGDLITYLVLSLSADIAQPIETIRERLSLLDGAQRRATMNVLNYLADHRNVRQARIVVDAWNDASGSR